MKRNLPLFLALIMLVNLCVACKKNRSGNPLDQLPPETQDGKNTFGCLVDGWAFTPRGSGGPTPIYDCYYQKIYATEGGYVFQVKGVRKMAKECEQGAVVLLLDSIKLEEGKTYDLAKIKTGKAGGSYTYFPSCIAIETQYKTSDNFNGKLYIKKLDEVQQIVAGTFWFTAVSPAGETVKITEGRFDMRYTK